MTQRKYLNTPMPKTREEIAEACKKYTFFTWREQQFAGGVAVEKTKGCYVWDYEGKKYFDLSSGQVYVNIGHHNDKVVNAIKEQTDLLTVIGPQFETDVRAVLGKKIVEELSPPNMGKVLFTLGGADANEYAIRIAKKYTGRWKIMSQYQSYHGSTYGASNLNGENERVVLQPTIAGFVHFLGPNWETHGLTFKDEQEECDFYVNILRQQLIREEPSSIAAIFFETITGSNGCIVPPKGYYEAVRKMCDEYGIMLVFDEVMSGWGRTGKQWAFEHYGVVPDIYTFAKGATCGYIPFGGTVVSKEISKFFDDAEFECGLTYNSHPISLACCLATIEVYDEEKLIENSAKMGELLGAGLKELKKKHPCIGIERGIGLFRTFEFVPQLNKPANNLAFVHDLEVNGYLTFPGHFGSIMICPPLIVTEEEINGILNVLDKCLEPYDKMI